ncbi:GNAT family N-acetyltransferase [Paenibacillus sp. NPDC056579]|uniref:GNAT family N-acetyltransferase n=1 Tax=unclassified Paenibacillus TaxID=185978 RepID=UPI001EF7550E|nr:GNAT family N-acetyltransferase [Paenibacillus sp. H1-7]ULL13858.1 GNAT family N-acetyltransferase [Paenibacillus sp. H1-7]
MLVRFRRCEGDEDLARFTLYFIRNRNDFSNDFTVHDTLLHVLEEVRDSHIIMIEDDRHHMIGWGHYCYVDENNEKRPDGEIAFVYSVILQEAYRSSRIFWQGFRHMANQIAAENTHVRHFRFHARQDNQYLNRMYSKFARIIGSREGVHGTENVYSTEISELYRYLNRS